MSRWIVLPILALAAITFYSIGNFSSLIVFLIIGFMFEMAFWFKAFPKRRKKLKR
ncbi:hypothetical protein [uncultured Paraglaciecola sp.]|uniref:hypothetical protein n=1 Tax=uncultured Paraglaciecola sp. TaxID=1765024 RepID=UPI0030D784BC|tara:strand:+ start:285058 stop:285222 length:165 start_codon:yes stop_codon:yes gene_type:complete